MLPLTLDPLDFQFVAGQNIMKYDLDAVLGNSIDLRISADDPVTVYLIAPPDLGGEFRLAQGQDIALKFKTLRFNRMEVRSKKSTNYAIRCTTGRDDLSGPAEFNDGVPVVLEPAPAQDQLLDQEAQRKVIRNLAMAGFDMDDITDIVAGLNSNEDLSFDDEEDLPTEAEMADIMETARARQSSMLDELDKGLPGEGEASPSEPEPTPEDTSEPEN